MTVGERIAQFRRQRHWKQSEFAQKVGVHTNHVSRWESDRMRPSQLTLQKIVDVFGITADELLDTKSHLPSSMRNNKAILEKMEQVMELDPDDQAVVFRIIDSFSLQKRVANLVGPPHKATAHVS